MSITQLLQSMPTKANDLFAKLADTSDGAIKTRERILGELKEELEQQARLEEKHLFPVLRKHAETKDLVAAAADNNKEVHKLLGELDAMPKEGGAFADKATELRKLFQRHIRDEKKELLPAVRKALTDDEQKTLAETLEAQKAVLQETARQSAKAARGAGETAGRVAETVIRVTENTERAAQAGTRAGADAGTELARTGIRVTADTAQRTAGTVERMTETAKRAMPAFGATPNVAVRAATEAGAAWMAYINRTALAGSGVTQRLTRCSSPLEMAGLQGEVMGEAVNAWFDMQNRLLEISMRASRDMVRPTER